MVIDLWVDIASVWLCVAFCFGIIAGTVFYHGGWVPVAAWPTFFAPVLIALGLAGGVVSFALFAAVKWGGA